jgi:hypothetical protein
MMKMQLSEPWRRAGPLRLDDDRSVLPIDVVVLQFGYRPFSYGTCRKKNMPPTVALANNERCGFVDDVSSHVSINSYASSSPGVPLEFP